MDLTGTRNTAGNGTALATANAGQKLRIGKFILLQLKATVGPVTALLKFGSTTVLPLHMTVQGDGLVLVDVPPMVSAAGDSLYLNLSDDKEVMYKIYVDMVGTP